MQKHRSMELSEVEFIATEPGGELKMVGFCDRTGIVFELDPQTGGGAIIACKCASFLEENFFFFQHTRCFLFALEMGKTLNRLSRFPQ